jgi:hypothetical protein
MTKLILEFKSELAICALLSFLVGGFAQIQNNYYDTNNYFSGLEIILGSSPIVALAGPKLQLHLHRIANLHKI